MKRIVAVTACPTGIAHTYMAASCLEKAAHKLGVHIRIETQGAMGIENLLTPQHIIQANCILIASDIEIDQVDRFKGYKVFNFNIEPVLIDPENVIKSCLEKC